MLSNKECEILLLLFKDFSSWYNATSISKVVEMTPRGSLKALTKLEKEEFVASRIFGKARQYKVKFNAITNKTIELLLLQEAEKNHKRWVEEFKGFEEANMLVLFGSALNKNQKNNDVDLLIIIDKKMYRKIMKKIELKNNLLLKPIHPIFQTAEDLINNILKKDKVMLDILKTGVVLKGQKDFVEVMENVASKQTY